MSHYSGKCDLADHISMLKHRTKDGSDKKEDLDKARVLYSDEMECFKIFKERTGGVIHQHKVIEVTPWNYDEVNRLTNGQFEAIPHTKTVPDKRQKSGERTDTFYTYKYWGKEYSSLKELNKRKVYITIDIRFETLLDIIPYYPYIVSSMCSCDGKDTVFISDESWVDSERDSRLKHGWYSDYWQGYKKELQDHYRDVVLRYFNPTGREHVEEVEFFDSERLNAIVGKVSKPIDPNFKVEWHWDGEVKTHWTSPKIYEASEGLVEISRQDFEHFIGKKAKLYYVEYKEPERYLW